MQPGRKTARWLTVAVGLLGAAVSAAQPVVLVVQEKLPLADGADPNVLIGPAVADELAASRRVRTVLWSVGDEEFVRWIQPEDVRVDVTHPDLKQAQGIAKRNDAEFVLWARASRTSQGVRPSAVLYHRGRKVWSFDPKTSDPRLPTGVRVSKQEQERWQRDAEAVLATSGMLIVIVDGQPDWNATAVSIARTWRSQLEQGPFARLAPAPSTDVPAGLTLDTLPGPPDADKLLDEAARHRASGDRVAEAALLRRAVDTRPNDPAARLLLAQALLALGLPSEAEAEAVAGARAATDPTEHWLLAADARIALGNLDGSRDALRRMLASGGEPAVTEPVIDLLEGDSAGALAKLKPLVGPRAAVWRAVASATLGLAEDLQAELGLLTGAERRLEERDYALFVIVLERFVQSIPDELRLLPAVIRSGEADAKRRTAQAAVRADCLSTLIKELESPARHARSHGGRRLAHALLHQAARETLLFAETGDEDARLDAALSLTEAVRNLEAVRELHAAERSSAGSELELGDGLDDRGGGGGSSGRARLLGLGGRPPQARPVLAS